MIRACVLLGWVIGCFASLFLMTFAPVFWGKLLGWLYASCSLAYAGLWTVLAHVHQIEEDRKKANAVK